MQFEDKDLPSKKEFLNVLKQADIDLKYEIQVVKVQKAPEVEVETSTKNEDVHCKKKKMKEKIAENQVKSKKNLEIRETGKIE